MIDKSEWKENKFCDIVENITLKAKPSECNNVPYVGLEHLSSDSFKVDVYGFSSDVTGEKIVIKKDDVLFGKRRAYQRKVGISPFDGIFSAHGMVLRPKKNVMLKEFLPFFIKSDLFMNRAIDLSVGSLSPTVNWKDLKDQAFLLPPIDEQKRIAELLWAAEDIITKYSNLIECCNQLLELEVNKIAESESETTKIGEHSLYIRGLTYSGKAESAYPTSNIVLRANNIDINSKKVIFDDLKYITGNFDERKKLLKDDILICAASGSPLHLGKTAYIDSNLDMFFGGFMAVIRCTSKHIIAKYLFYLLNTLFFRNYLSKLTEGTNIKNLKSIDILNFRIPLIDIECQKELLFKLDQIQNTIDECKILKQKAVLLQKSIIDERC